MNTLDKNHRSKRTQWQVEKMRRLIEENWSEIWSVVVARELSTLNLQHQHSDHQLKAKKKEKLVHD